jgi:hypothetical protein
MNFNHYLIYCICHIYCFAFGQNEVVYISGNIKSNTDKKVLEKTTVLALQNNKVIKSVQTTNEGNFQIEVPQGTYLLKYYKDGFDTAQKNNITLKEGEQVILALYLKEKRTPIVCNALSEEGFQVYDKMCLSNSKLIQGELSPEQACNKYIRFPCVYQVRKVRFKIIIDENGKVVWSKQIAAIDNSNKQYLETDKYPFWEDAGKEGKRILNTLLFDIPQLKLNQTTVKTFTSIDIPISCK